MDDLHIRIEQEIAAAEGRRCVAMLANDKMALDAVLDPELQFHHATGTVDDKSGYLAKMASGSIAYLSIEWAEQIFTAVSEDAALLTGRMVTNVLVEGLEKRLNNRVMTVWRKNRGAWQMLAFQSTPMPV